ncbi:histidine kinase [Streptomyces sp. NPDC049577]|uniref:sensor histidine kinase n=1 Tax=Streptomyces sp. NPDC049577 TaxID=3155153 RepID=UPI0034486179
MSLLSYAGMTVLNLLGQKFSHGALALGLLGLFAICFMQYFHSAPEAPRRLGRRKYLTLGIQALFTYLPIVIYGNWWGNMAGFLAGSLLLLLPPRPAWALYGAVSASMFFSPLLSGRTAEVSLYHSQMTMLCGVVVYGLSHLSQVIQALLDTRRELARMAVTRERLRFSRDLHDLLGYSLSSITLKSELIRRLIPVQPEQAVREVAEVLAISRQSLADVRTVASGYREMSLEQELLSARSVLTAAEVGVRTDISLDKVSRQVDTVLATVLREAVTNVLRHSKAGSCVISVARSGRGRVRLSVVNDGADPAHRDVSPDSGSGLGNLATRLEAVGGRLIFSRSDEGVFRLEAEAPAVPDDDEPVVPAREFAVDGPAM